MAGGKETFFLTVEWTVKHFDCWNRKIHGKKITSPKFKAGFDLITLSLELFPKEATSNHVAVKVRYKSNSDISGVFFLTTPAGPLLWSHELRAPEGAGVLELTSAAPAFEEVKREEELTLKCRIVWDCDEVHRARTVIDVFDSAWKLTSPVETGDVKFLATIRYPLDDDEEEVGELSLSLIPSLNHLVLEPEDYRWGFSKVAVATRLELEGGRRTEVREHLFLDRKRWVLCDSIQEGSVLHVRVIPENRPKHERDFVFDPGSVREVDHPFRSIPSDIPPKTRSDDDLSRDMRSLYLDREYSDFRIRCDGVSFPVHRAVLSARSPVFKAMLSSDMTEATSGQLEVTDMEPDTLGHFLTFLYSGVLHTDCVIDLYYAADKYQVPSLKARCADFLCRNVSVSNVCEVLSVADQHRDERVTSAARDFVLENFDAVMTSGEWEGFLEREPLLADRIHSSVSARRGTPSVISSLTAHSRRSDVHTTSKNSSSI